MTSDFLVSVLVRTMNRPEMLSQALESIANQTYKNIEVLVINDGGLDVSSIIDIYAPRIHRLNYRPIDHNLGRSAALNYGLDLASGQLIGFLDDDDWWDEDHISNLIAVFQGNTLVAYSGTRAIVDDGTNQIVKIFNSEFDRHRLFYQNYIPINAILISNSVFSKGCRFDKNLEMFEDWDCWIKLLAYTQLFIHVPTVTANYRIHHQQAFGLQGDDKKARRIIHCRGAKLWGDNEVDDLLTRLSYFSSLIE